MGYKFCIWKVIDATHIFLILAYGKCPKISYTKIADKMAYANSVDPDQTAPSGAVWSGSTLFAIPLSILKKQLHF